MYVINARNAHQALPVGLHLLQKHGIKESSRAGDVLRYPGPVTTVLQAPCERVIFHAWRDANPFFHIVEAAWMLAGRNDLAQLTRYVKKMGDFTDDGVTQPGAYGYRWRKQFPRSDGENIDQLDWVVRRLRANPNDRRVVIQMWDPCDDVGAADNNGADVPCNLTMLPWVMNGALHLTIFNRSNDIIWGLYGANAVHFSMCLEYLAGRIGLDVGTMTTVSNNFHAYVDKIPASMDVYLESKKLGDPYEAEGFGYPLVSPWKLLDGIGPEDTDIMQYEEPEREYIMQNDLRVFFEHGAVTARGTARWPWMRRVLIPMALAHRAWKITKGPERYTDAMSYMSKVAASDWRRAGEEWLMRRKGAAVVAT